MSKNAFDEINQAHIDFYENAELPDYEDTYYKDLADDLKTEIAQLRSDLDTHAATSTKQFSVNRTIAVIALIVGALTLIATIVGVVLQFFI